MIKNDFQIKAIETADVSYLQIGVAFQIHES